MGSEVNILYTATAAALAALASICSPTPASAHSAPPAWPAVYLVPHQDDETLVMGASILQHVEAGRQVWIFLATDGSATQACKTLGLSPAACTAERDREFRAAARSLGVPDSHVRIATRPDGSRYRDGSLTYSDARAILSWAVNTVRRANAGSPRMSVKAPSWTDDHPDHAALGAALRDASVSDARFFLKDFSPARPQAPKGTRVGADRPHDHSALYAARDAYRSGAGVGYLSVRPAFDYVVAHPWRRTHTRVGK